MKGIEPYLRVRIEMLKEEKGLDLRSEPTSTCPIPFSEIQRRVNAYT